VVLYRYLTAYYFPLSFALPAHKAIFSDTQMLIYVLEQMHAGFFESVSK